MRALAFALLLLFSLVARASDSMEPSVSYDFVEKRETASDHRKCHTWVGVLADGRLFYSYDEEVSGSITPRVEAIQFRRERRITADERRQLFDALLDARVFDLAGDSRGDPGAYGNLRVRIGDQSAMIDLSSAAPFPAARRIHEILLGFAKRMKVDELEDLAAALHVTEGDRQPVCEVKLADLLRSPAGYHGKRVRVTGFSGQSPAGNRLSVVKRFSPEDLLDKGILLVSASEFAEKTDFKTENDTPVQVEGIYLHERSGHLGMFSGAVTRITRVDPISR